MFLKEKLEEETLIPQILGVEEDIVGTTSKSISKEKLASKWIKLIMAEEKLTLNEATSSKDAMTVGD